MPTVIPRMHVHSLRSSKTYFTHQEQSHTGMLAQKLVDLLPRSPMSRSILRSFGIECNVDKNVESSGPLACLTRAAHNLPGIVRRACSPVFVKSGGETSKPDIEHPKPSDRLRHSAPNRVLKSPSASQENTPPPPKRGNSRTEASHEKRPVVSTNEPPKIEPRVLRPRTSNPVHLEHDKKVIQPKTEKPSQPSTPLPCKSTVKSTPKSEKSDSPVLLTPAPHYHQPHFNVKSFKVSENCPQKLIEVPSWRVNDIIEERYSEEANSRQLRLRRSSIAVRRTSTRSAKRCRLSGRDAEVEKDEEEEVLEDTSDEVFRARHARLEAEEIRRERLSDKRIAEEELRLRMEQRERESWRKRHNTRVDSFVDIDPERFMPTSFFEPINKVRFIHVQDEIPIIAFGVKVPKLQIKPLSKS